MPSSSRDHRFAYGLHFESEFTLPELPVLPSEQQGETPNVVVEVGPTLSRASVEALVTPDAPIANVMTFDETQCRVLFSEVARVSVREGKHAFVEPVEGTTSEAWRLPLLGSMLALLLEQRGLFSLHAGAVEMPGPDGPVACAFAAEKGQGKSTLNAALSLAGFPLLCDDVLGLDMSDKVPVALRGFGSVKLVPDAVRAVVKCSPDELPQVAPEIAQVSGIDKRHFTTSLAPHPRPLRHVFLLNSHEDADRDDIELQPLPIQDALAMLLPHTFGVRWGDLYLTPKRSAIHLKACAQIVTGCHVWKLSRRRDLALLPQTIELIAHTAQNSA